MTPIMQTPHYALVAYVGPQVGDFIESVRRELHPELPLMAAHLTILPPRCLSGVDSRASKDNEAQALDSIAEMCRTVTPFEILLGDVETFVPVTPTVYIRVEHEAPRMHELHDRLNHGILRSEEQWPYIPHLTIVKMASESQALNAFEVARQRWTQYGGTRRILVEQLTFVREGENNTWVDLAPIPLGRTLVSGQTY
jgi:2'-5' RNA ligase